MIATATAAADFSCLNNMARNAPWASAATWAETEAAEAPPAAWRAAAFTVACFQESGTAASAALLWVHAALEGPR